MGIAQADIDSLLASGNAATAVAEPPPDDFLPRPPRGAAASEPGSPELSRILHMRVPIIVRVAERQLPVSEVLKFNVGTLLEFARPADEDMDLLVNNRRIGQGRPVKVGENFGLRLTVVGGLQGTIQALGS